MPIVLITLMAWSAPNGAIGGSWGSPEMLKAFLLVVVGLSGDPEHGKTFQKWGATLARGVGPLGHAAGAPRLPRRQAGRRRPSGVNGPATRDEIAKAFERSPSRPGPDDVMFVTLIGHGSFDGGTAKFNLPGPDMTAADFDALLQKLPTKQIVFVNTSSSSGPFVEALSGPGRTIVTATRNGAEQYATLFGGFFVDALTSEAADADKNRRVSVLEAFNYAKAEVARAYEREGLLATEHALLDDNGDKEGSQTPASPARTARSARRQSRRHPARSAPSAPSLPSRSEAARAVSGAARPGAPRRSASAAEGQHAGGEVPGGARKPGDRLALKAKEIRAAEGGSLRKPESPNRRPIRTKRREWRP